jgi:hypothetical protein
MKNLYSIVSKDPDIINILTREIPGELSSQYVQYCIHLSEAYSKAVSKAFKLYYESYNSSLSRNLFCHYASLTLNQLNKSRVHFNKNVNTPMKRTLDTPYCGGKAEFTSEF